ncbi:MAG: methionine--tRNA ligase [Spirochaetes bacterium GWF1_31_7]|nr:MAG: methionine--tRNA ligase [Spirochaetes bacterium GWE1_32_154]OHD52587.1 MAG: methionine--tRNA ligase [Spirochaetes bacterium GWE2_31_10]OHD52955.1 MAG: methionine--tRNA ligase [Spirochaetes bacterium GWF1_31_7]OHD80241.1 MAG: methionine--tRNA ligase [Spirochaetes bacterium RIFOXYB1_FULL_32_8]HBD93698.1 methionine--tRNA ligase [Spirochaetia bacterium]
MSSNKRKILITSALPYVNNIPHLGNIIGCVLSADVFAKYCTISGYETMFVSGTDEYGTTTVTRAKQEGITPKQLCDKYHAIHKDIYDWFNISFSHFGRTSCDEQTEIVQSIFKEIYDKGYIVEDTITQPFCIKCDMYLADRYIEGTCPHCGYEKAKGDQCESCGKLLDPAELKSPQCSSCGEKPVFKDTNHLFLDLEKLKGQIEDWVTKQSEFGQWSNNALMVTKGWIEQGLKKRCITRDLDWGVKVPLKGFENKVFYVWFDAPIGYISITANKFKDWKSWWKSPDDVELFQFMGKDNIPFHTVLFPASLLATGDNWTMLKTISSTEYLNYEEQKFSKSRGTGVFGDQAKNSGIDPDLYRYYLLRNRPEKNDTQFFWNDFMEKVNGEIIANYANLVNRVLQFSMKFFDGSINLVDTSDDSVFKFADFENKVNSIKSLYEKVELKKALLEILELCSYGNKFFQDNEPWKIIKEDKEKTNRIISSLFGFVRDISILLYPYIPGAITRYFNSINLSTDTILISNIGNYDMLKGLQINPPGVLFTKLEKELVEKLKEQFAGKKEIINPAEEFSTIALKTGKIISIERHPEADKLYVEKVDMGNGEIRQVVSGLVPYYKEDELLNKVVIIVYNLKPANLRGVLSEGMLLAADDKKAGIVEVLFPDCNEGHYITIHDSKPNTQIIGIEDFAKVPLTVKNNCAEFKNTPLQVAGKKINTVKITQGNIR